MPKLPTPCSYSGCPNLVEAGKRYCPEHMRQYYRHQSEKRGTAAQRGYDSRWQRVREMYLRRHPLCELCEQEGRITPATIVHHKQPIKHGGHALDMENLMSVCRECHIRLHTGKECTP
ncbi:HNH endonuclease [Desulfovirgula thermocuniculi]|uniref:HNH endonuclease n=1 Tax=Desulfovirgula thermocuniculi TaxID=348842 RepID=UPI000480A915